MVDDAASIALADDRDAVAEADLIEAIRHDGQIVPEDTLDPAAMHRVGIHEAGHVAVCVALRGAPWVYSVRMGGPQGDGATSFGDEAVPVSQRPDDEARDALTVCFGGLASEIACLTEGSNGALGDIQSASELALSRIRSGVTEEPAPVDLYCLQGNVAESLKEAYAKDLETQLARPDSWRSRSSPPTSRAFFASRRRSRPRANSRGKPYSTQSPTPSLSAWKCASNDRARNADLSAGGW